MTLPFCTTQSRFLNKFNPTNNERTYGSGARSTMLLVRIIENKKIMPILVRVRLSKG